MRMRIERVLMTVLTLMLLAATPSLAGPCENTGNPADLDNCFILRAPRGLQTAIANGHGLAVLRDLASTDLDMVVVEGPANLLPATTLANLRADPDVIEVEPLRLESLAENESALLNSGGNALAALGYTAAYSGPEASYFTDPVWNGLMIQPPTDLVQLYDGRDPATLESYGAGVVAIIDTGVDPTHVDLQGALVPGYDLLLRQEGVIASEWSALDPATRAQAEQDLRAAGDQSYGTLIEGNATTVYESPSVSIIVDQSYGTLIEGQELPFGFGHGTMVAGLVRLVAPRAQIMPIRAFDGSGQASLADIVEAIYWAVDNGAQVINMSFSVAESSKALERAIMHAKKKSVVMVSSAGNYGTEALTYPAAYGQVIGVASSSANDHVSSFSNTGPHVTLTAPGDGIVTLYPGNLYAGVWGTSFSAGWVSGTVALLHGVKPNGTLSPVRPAFAESALEDSADALGGPGSSSAGAGRLDVEGAYHLNLGETDVDP